MTTLTLHQVAACHDLALHDLKQAHPEEYAVYLRAHSERMKQAVEESRAEVWSTRRKAKGAA